MAKTKSKGPKLYDEMLLLQAGISPDILKRAFVGQTRRNRTNNLEGFKKVLRVLDEQDAINRYRWYNLPGGIDGQDLERMLYSKGQVCLFWYEELNEFYFMPYALDGTIDFYGRFNRIHPVPYYEGKDDDGKARQKAMTAILSTLKLYPQYDVVDELPKGKRKADLCVLLHDYAKPFNAQEIIPRVRIQEPVITFEAESFPLCRTAMIGATGTRATRVQDSDEAEQVEQVNDQINSAALSGSMYIPAIGQLDFQDLPSKPGAGAEDYLMMMQAIDNFRLSLYGIENGGLFQKKAHKLEGEQRMNEGPASLPYDDGLTIRQRFCNIANSIWPIGMWCERPDSLKGKSSDMAPEGDGVGESGKKEGRDDA